MQTFKKTLDLKESRQNCYFIALIIFLCLGEIFIPANANADSKQNEKPGNAVMASSVLDDMKAVAPEFAKLTEDHLFGDIWKRPPLSARDKSFVTITVLLSLNRIEQMDGHFARALNNGVTKEELVGIITHVAYYAGWPTAASGLVHLKKVLDERESKSKNKK